LGHRSTWIINFKRRKKEGSHYIVFDGVEWSLLCFKNSFLSFKIIPIKRLFPKKITFRGINPRWIKNFKKRKKKGSHYIVFDGVEWSLLCFKFILEFRNHSYKALVSRKNNTLGHIYTWILNFKRRKKEGSHYIVFDGVEWSLLCFKNSYLSFEIIPIKRLFPKKITLWGINPRWII
jgi:hypothetical protein